MRVFQAALAAFFLAISSAQAAVIANIWESGSDVQASFSGSLDVNGLGSGAIEGDYSGTYAQLGIFQNVPSGFDIPYGLYAASGPSSFGGSSRIVADSSTGSNFLIFGLNSSVGVDAGYVSGSALAGSQLYGSQTLAGMGLTQGTYVWTLGSQDTVTLIIGQAPAAVPLPASLPLMLGAFGLVGLGLRRRRRA